MKQRPLLPPGGCWSPWICHVFQNVEVLFFFLMVAHDKGGVQLFVGLHGAFINCLTFWLPLVYKSEHLVRNVCLKKWRADPCIPSETPQMNTNSLLFSLLGAGYPNHDPRSHSLLEFSKVVLSSSAPGFLKHFQRFSWTMAAFSPIFSPVLHLIIFRGMILCWLRLRNQSGINLAPKSRDEPLLWLQITDKLAKNQF